MCIHSRPCLWQGRRPGRSWEKGPAGTTALNCGHLWATHACTVPHVRCSATAGVTAAGHPHQVAERHLHCGRAEDRWGTHPHHMAAGQVRRPGAAWGVVGEVLAACSRPLRTAGVCLTVPYCAPAMGRLRACTRTQLPCHRHHRPGACACTLPNVRLLSPCSSSPRRVVLLSSLWPSNLPPPRQTCCPLPGAAR